MSSNATLQSDVEKDTAQINLYNGLLGSVPAIIVTPLLGAYSDTHGRKIPMMLPLLGYTFSSLGRAVSHFNNIFYFNECELGKL